MSFERQLRSGPVEGELSEEEEEAEDDGDEGGVDEDAAFEDEVHAVTHRFITLYTVTYRYIPRSKTRCMSCNGRVTVV